MIDRAVRFFGHPHLELVNEDGNYFLRPERGVYTVLRSLEEFKGSTLEEGIDFLVDSLMEHERKLIIENGYIPYHHGFGTNLRNTWKLWEGDSPIRKHLMERFNLDHGDDLSSLLLAGVEAKLKGLPYDPEGVAERCRVHWRGMGIDPSQTTKT